MKLNNVVRIGSRRSDLALAQSRKIKELFELRSGRQSKIIEVDTKGDLDLQTPLPEIGGKGLFTHELEVMLMENKVDIAVHSLKDLPVEFPDGLMLGAVTAREDPRDVLVTRHGEGLHALAPGATVGSGSPRRGAQLLHRRGDLRLVPMRGNVPTRIKKLDRGDCDAILLAAAGLKRLGLLGRVSEYFSTDVIIPAPGQGALGIECRSDDTEMLVQLAECVGDAAATVCCAAERRVLDRLGGGCSLPLGAFALISRNTMRLTAVVAQPDGNALVFAEREGPPDKGNDIADAVTDDLLRAGAAEILDAVRDDG